MNLKKLSLLVASGLMFFIVLTTIIKTIEKSVYLSKERDIAALANEMDIEKKISSFNYVEVKEEKKEETENKDEEVKQQQSIEETKQNVVQKQEEVQPVATYTGKLTGYGGDCPGCSGYVACHTANGGSFNLKTDGMYYNDNAYGNVRILSAATNAFPCGTIIEVSNGIMNTFNAVVLDTGGSMKAAWNNGTVWMDLAFSTASDPSLGQANSGNTTFKVLRQGW